MRSILGDLVAVYGMLKPKNVWAHVETVREHVFRTMSFGQHQLDRNQLSTLKKQHKKHLYSAVPVTYQE